MAKKKTDKEKRSDQWMKEFYERHKDDPPYDEPRHFDITFALHFDVKAYRKQLQQEKEERKRLREQRKNNKS